MFTRVIVGIDNSGPSMAALRWALRYVAGHPGIPLVLEHVAREDADGPGERALQQAVELAAVADRAAHALIAHGDPARVLADDAAPGELLVIGSHKTGYLRGRVSGTRSLLVATMSPASTVIVPEGTLGSRNGVVVGVSGDPSSHAAVTAGAIEAQQNAEELLLVHSTDGAPIQAPDARAMLAAAVELATLTAPGLTVRQRVSHSRVSDALLDASRSARLLVIGARGTDALRPVVPGTVMHEVLLNLNSPVMIAR